MSYEKLSRSRRRKIEGARLIIYEGAPVDARDSSGETALQWMTGELKFVRDFFEENVERDARIGRRFRKRRDNSFALDYARKLNKTKEELASITEAGRSRAGELSEKLNAGEYCPLIKRTSGLHYNILQSYVQAMDSVARLEEVCKRKTKEGKLFQRKVRLEAARRTIRRHIQDLSTLIESGSFVKELAAYEKCQAAVKDLCRRSCIPCSPPGSQSQAPQCSQPEAESQNDHESKVRLHGDSTQSTGPQKKKKDTSLQKKKKKTSCQEASVCVGNPHEASIALSQEVKARDAMLRTAVAALRAAVLRCEKVKKMTAAIRTGTNDLAKRHNVEHLPWCELKQPAGPLRDSRLVDKLSAELPVAFKAYCEADEQAHVARCSMVRDKDLALGKSAALGKAIDRVMGLCDQATDMQGRFIDACEVRNAMLTQECGVLLGELLDGIAAIEGTMTGTIAAAERVIHKLQQHITWTRLKDEQSVEQRVKKIGTVSQSLGEILTDVVSNAACAFWQERSGIDTKELQEKVVEGVEFIARGWGDKSYQREVGELAQLMMHFPEARVHEHKRLFLNATVMDQLQPRTVLQPFGIARPVNDFLNREPENLWVSCGVVLKSMDGKEGEGTRVSEGNSDK